MSCLDHLVELSEVLGKMSKNTNSEEDSLELFVSIASSICKEDGNINTFKGFLETINHLKTHHFDANREEINKIYKENKEKYGNC